MNFNLIMVKMCYIPKIYKWFFYFLIILSVLYLDYCKADSELLSTVEPGE